MRKRKREKQKAEWDNEQMKDKSQAYVFGRSDRQFLPLEMKKKEKKERNKPTKNSPPSDSFGGNVSRIEQKATKMQQPSVIILTVDQFAA